MSKTKVKNMKTIQQLRGEIKRVLDNKYYNLWMSKYESDLDPQVFNYLFKKLYEEGTIAGFKVKHTEELGLALYSTQAYNMYDFPEIISLTNVRNSPVIPSVPMRVNKDAVICYCQSNHKSIKFIVDKYISKLVEVEMVINTQLITHKLPFLIGIAPEDESRATEIVNDILNDKPVIFVDFEDLNLVKVLANANPYILDKLIEYK